MCEFKSPMTNYKILNSALALMPLKIHELTYKKKTCRKPVRRVELPLSRWTDFPRDEPIYPAQSGKNIEK